MSSHANIHAVRDTLYRINDILLYISRRFSVPTINSNFVKMLVGYSIDRNEELEPEMIFCFIIGRSHMEWDEFLTEWNSLTKGQKKPYKKLASHYYDYIEKDDEFRFKEIYKDPDSDSDDDEERIATEIEKAMKLGLFNSQDDK